MPLNCGIVGLPNVGKSTIFNALTASKAQAANYPFCTIDPNVGIVPVPDERMDRIVTMVKPNSIVTAKDLLVVLEDDPAAVQSPGERMSPQTKKDAKG